MPLRSYSQPQLYGTTDLFVVFAPTGQAWNDYVQHMVKRKKDTQYYPSDQTIMWLGWLARQMRDHNQTSFHLEQLQLDWLPQRKKSFYRWILGPLGGLVGGLLFGLVYGLLFGLVSWLVFRMEISGTGEQSGWLVFGLGGSGADGQYYGLAMWIREQGFHWLVSVWLGDQFDWLVSGLVSGLMSGLACGLIGGLTCGLRARMEPAEVLTWSWKNMIEEDRLLVVPSLGLLGWLVGWLVNGRFPGLADGLINGLLAGLAGGLICGIFGFSRKQLPRHLMLSPNEGIRRSVKNGLVIGLISGLIITLSCILLGWLFGGLFGEPLSGLEVGLVLGLSFGPPVWLYFGLVNGLGAAIQHCTLRIFLWRTYIFPWKAQRFLDHAVTCILLRRVGGGYSFVHRLLLDYLADLYIRPTPTSVTNLPAPSNSLPPNNPSA